MDNSVENSEKSTKYSKESVFRIYKINVENAWITCGYMVDKSEDFHIGKESNYEDIQSMAQS